MTPPSTDALACTDLDSCVLHLKRAGLARLDAASLGRLLSLGPTDLPALAGHWNDLPPDDHLKDGGRYRQRRHASLMQTLGDSPGSAALQAVPHRPHWQPTTYNALHGGMLRHFAPVMPALADAPAWRALVAGLGVLFGRVRSPADSRWYIEAHPFRITTAGGVGRPTPEGAHRDGVDFVAVVLVGRHHIIGGETRVFAADGPQGLRFTLDQPWSVLLLDDTRVIHESTPIQPDDVPLGWRDTLVLTYRAGGFQDPPAAPAP
ncbi:MAG: hypothetical protein RIQ60_3785 [Pseudomonadota bacterium]|jgi:hypothetical protein